MDRENLQALQLDLKAQITNLMAQGYSFEQAISRCDEGDRMVRLVADADNRGLVTWIEQGEYCFACIQIRVPETA
jgi:hypothetical protein